MASNTQAPTPEPASGGTQDLLTAAWSRNKRYSLADAKREIAYELTNSPRARNDDPDVSKCVLLLGEAGIGKTRCVKQAAMEAKVPFYSYHHGATIEEDNHGLPIVVDGVARHAPAAHIAPVLLRPGEQDDPNQRSVLFIDEIFSGQGMGHQNFVRMLIDRRYNEMSLRSGCLLVAATNPELPEYGTVRAADHALVSRMLIVPVQPTAEERLEYWADRFPSQRLYGFLLLQKEFISKMDSRSWYNLAHSLAKREAAGAPLEHQVRLVALRAGDDVAAALRAFLERGDNPEYYPVSAHQLLMGSNDDHKAAIKMARVWSDKLAAQKEGKRQRAEEVAHCRPLLTATCWRIKSLLRVRENDVRPEVEPVKRLISFFEVMTDCGMADVVDDFFSAAGQGSVGSAIFENFKGTKAHTALQQRVARLHKQQETATAGAAT